MPRMLTPASAAGASTDARTSICAARWQISSGPNAATSSLSAAASVMLSLCSGTCGSSLPARPEDRSSSDENVVSPCQQGVSDMGADETGTAGDKYAHTDSS